jgi:hypothetical protein
MADEPAVTWVFTRGCTDPVTVSDEPLVARPSLASAAKWIGRVNPWARSWLSIMVQLVQKSSDVMTTHLSQTSLAWSMSVTTRVQVPVHRDPDYQINDQAGAPCIMCCKRGLPCCSRSQICFRCASRSAVSALIRMLRTVMGICLGCCRGLRPIGAAFLVCTGRAKGSPNLACRSPRELPLTEVRCERRVGA